MASYPRFHPPAVPYTPQSSDPWASIQACSELHNFKAFVKLADATNWGTDVLKPLRATNQSPFTVVLVSDNAADAHQVDQLVNSIRSNKASPAAETVKQTLNKQLVQGNMIPALTARTEVTLHDMRIPSFASLHVAGAEPAPFKWLVFPASAKGDRPDTFNHLGMVDNEGQFVQINSQVKMVVPPSDVQGFSIVILEKGAAM